MRAVITERDVPQTGELRVAVGTIFTPSARDLAASRGVRIVELAPEKLNGCAPPEKTIAIGADHGGYRLKEHLKPLLAEFGLDLEIVSAGAAGGEVTYNLRELLPRAFTRGDLPGAGAR